MAFIYVNPNPREKRIGDCVVRALSLAEGQRWAKTYRDLAVLGMEMCDMPSSNGVWGEYLKRRGYTRHIIPDTCPDCYSIKKFSTDHKKGSYIVGTGSHVVYIKNGNYMDTWDSGDETAIFYYTKEE